MINTILLVLYVVFAVGGSTLIKYGGLGKIAALFVVPVVNVGISTITILGIFCYGLSFILYILLLNKLDLSYVSPITIGAVYTLLMITAVFIFKEQFTVVKTLGCLLIFIGLMFVLSNK